MEIILREKSQEYKMFQHSRKVKLKNCLREYLPSGKFYIALSVSQMYEY